MSVTPSLEHLFHEARARPPGAERDRYLDETCGEDEGLRQRVDALLRADADEGGILREPSVARAPVGEVAGQRIDRYKLLEQIGEGGFGTVWMAEQREPVKRRVALKVIKLGMDTKQVIARFEAERQALAMMEHPNIARVLDAGATDAGRPFFVMELVRGVPIVEYCDDEELATRERLALFVSVCHAIQHAHHKGIIHRDVKPSNVLVTLHDGVPVPKVIDFGIAKATNQELTQKTLFTGHRQIVGTPAYMAPEQAEMSGLDIDTRADVYALGVLLYELLTGTTPFDVKALSESGYEELLRAIREDVPHKPSSRVSTQRDAAAARRRRADVQKLRSLLRGDLDWIVMKCLEKDRARRYATVNALAADVQRHLDHEPVSARRPSLAYQLQKLVKRHRVAVTATVAVLVVLVLGFIGTTGGMLWAFQEREVAMEQARRTAFAAASLSFRNGEFVKGRAMLEKVPVERRDWIWELLRAQVDEPVATFEGSSQAFTVESRLRIVTTRGVEEWSSPGVGRRLLFEPDLAEGETAALTLDGALLVIRSKEKDETHCRVLDVESGVVLSRFTMEYGRFVLGYAHLAHRTKDTLQIRDLRTGSELASLSGPEACDPLAFSPEDERLAVNDAASGLRILDLETLAPASGFRSQGHQVQLAGFSPDGRRLVSVSVVRGPDLEYPREVVIWDAATGEPEFGDIGIQVPGQTYGVAFSADGSRVAVSSRERVLLLNPVTRQVERTFPGDVQIVAFAPDGSTIAMFDRFGGKGRIWDVRDSRSLEGHRSYVYPVAFSPDGRRVVSGGMDGTLGREPGCIRVWDAETGAAIASLGELGSAVHSLTFTADGAQFVTCGPVRRPAGGITFWDAATGAIVDEFPGRFSNCALSPDERTLAAHSGGKLVLIDRWTRVVRERLALLEGVRTAPAFSPDGSLVAAARKDFCVVLFDVMSLDPVTELPGHELSVTSIVFRADGERLLTTSRDDTIRIWDPHTGQELAVLRGPRTDAMCALFAPDGEHVISGGRDGLIRIWHIADREVIAELAGHRGYVYSLALSPDGKTIASASGDTTVRLWRTASPIATRRATEERNELVSDLGPRVTRLIEELEDFKAVVAALREDLEGWRLEVALQVALERAAVRRR